MLNDEDNKKDSFDMSDEELLSEIDADIKEVAPEYQVPPAPVNEPHIVYANPIKVIETEKFGKLLLISQSPAQELEMYHNESRSVLYVFFRKKHRFSMDLKYALANNLIFNYSPQNLKVLMQLNDGTQYLIMSIPNDTEYTAERDLAWALGFDNYDAKEAKQLSAAEIEKMEQENDEMA